jgi:Na+/melibiose symporter-like transporter
MFTQIRNKMKRLYFYSKDLTDQDYQRSRLKLILSGSTASIINTLTAGSFLIGYLVYLGAPEQYCAIIGAIPQLGCILQMLSPYIFERLKHRKLLICISCFLFRFSVGTLIFVPYLIGSRMQRLIFIMIVYTFGYFVAGFVTPGLNHWNLSVAPEKSRGRFLAIKDIVSMFSVSVISILTGRILDYYKIINKQMIGFTIMFGVALLLSMIDFFLISHIEEPIVHREPTNQTLWQLIKNPLTDKKFRKIILFLSIWSFAVQFSVSFIPIFMLSSLKLSYSFIATVAVTGNILGMISVYLWGHLADKTSWSHLLRISGCIIAFCYFGWSFVTPDNAMILVFILQIALTCCNGAFQMASSNLQFNLSPHAGKTAYLGVTAAISCVISFVGAMLGSILFKQFQEVKINIFSFEITNMKILFLITGLLLAIALIFIKKQHQFVQS